MFVARVYRFRDIHRRYWRDMRAQFQLAAIGIACSYRHNNRKRARTILRGYELPVPEEARLSIAVLGPRFP